MPTKNQLESQLASARAEIMKTRSKSANEIHILENQNRVLTDRLHQANDNMAMVSKRKDALVLDVVQLNAAVAALKKHIADHVELKQEL